jgi:cytochrome c556
VLPGNNKVLGNTYKIRRCIVTKFVFLLTGMLSILLIALGSTVSQAETKGGAKQKNNPNVAASPPRSLDAFFPPKAEQPIYLFRKLGLGSFFAGIVADLFENDPQNAKTNFETFKAQYVEISKLVPEWEKDFRIGPVEELGAALETGDRGKIMTAYERVGNLCRDCHIANMIKAHQKYHWGDFSAITVTDPLTKEQIDFLQLMRYLDVNYFAIGLDVAQGQKGNAQKQFQGFNTRFQTLKETCGNCHNSERKYYIDEDVQAMIDQLGRTLRESPIDPKKVGTLIQEIGMESCFKCHLVHFPAAFAKAEWAKRKKTGGK